MEFNIGDTVTLDRYNHIDDVEVVKIIDIVDSWSPGGGKEYVMDVNGVHIRSTGMSLMESKHYVPVPDEDRHEKKFKGMTTKELKIHWNKVGRFE